MASRETGKGGLRKIGGCIMAEIREMMGMLERGLAGVLDFWPIKTVCAAVGGVLCWLLNGTGVVFAVVCWLVALDTLTKWVAITKRYLQDHGTPKEKITLFAVIPGFFCAWEKGYLESSTLRRCWGDKLFTYLVLIIGAGLVAKLPEIMLFGVAVNTSIVGGVYTCIALTELISICENFAEMGNQAVASLKVILGSIINKVTGGNFSFTFNTKPPDEGDKTNEK